MLHLPEKARAMNRKIMQLARSGVSVKMARRGQKRTLGFAPAPGSADRTNEGCAFSMLISAVVEPGRGEIRNLISALILRGRVRCAGGVDSVNCEK